MCTPEKKQGRNELDNWLGADIRKKCCTKRIYEYQSPPKALFTRAIFVWQFLCDEFYLLVYTRTCARILCGKYICRKTSLPVFMWQTKIANYEYLFVYMTRHIFVACIYLHVCQALCDYNIALKTNFLRTVKKYLLYHLHEQSYLSWKMVKQKLFV